MRGGKNHRDFLSKKSAWIVCKLKQYINKQIPTVLISPLFNIPLNQSNNSIYLGISPMSRPLNFHLLLHLFHHYNMKFQRLDISNTHTSLILTLATQISSLISLLLNICTSYAFLKYICIIVTMRVWSNFQQIKRCDSPLLSTHITILAIVPLPSIPYTDINLVITILANISNREQSLHNVWQNKAYIWMSRLCWILFLADFSQLCLDAMSLQDLSELLFQTK